MNSAAHLRAVRLRFSRLRCRPSHQPFQHPIRHASAETVQATAVATDIRSAGTRSKNFIYGSLLTFGLIAGYLYVTDTRASFHEWLLVPALRQLYPDGEDAHHAGTRILKALYSFGMNPRERGMADSTGDLAIEIFGHTLSNPIGTSAGIDKGAEVPTPLFQLGAGLVEVGAITLQPQEGNAKPRVFRLPSQNALINRYGFNSEGAEMVASRLRQRVREFAYHAGLGLEEEAERLILDGEAGVPPGSLIPGRLMAVQIAKNKTTSETDIEAVVRDYASAVGYVGKYADILVVNVSSPNTAGLRTLQNVEPLTRLLSGVVQAVSEIDRKTKPAIMVKVSPDEDSEDQVSGICEAIWESGVDGVIVGNTTKQRPDPLPRGYVLPTEEAKLLLEQGGYSGPQMFQRTLALVSRYRKMLDAGPKRQTPPAPSSSEPQGNTSQEESNAPKDTSGKGNVLGQTSKITDFPSESTPSLNIKSPSRKVIFATGGITNGRQAREILNAGASVAQVYTAMIYGGAGTISRIKQEMRDEAKPKGTTVD